MLYYIKDGGQQPINLHVADGILIGCQLDNGNLFIDYSNTFSRLKYSVCALLIVDPMHCLVVVKYSCIAIINVF